MNIENTDVEFFFYDDQELVIVYLEKPIENSTNWPPARICRQIESLRNQYDMALSPDAADELYEKMTAKARMERYLHPDWNNHMTAEDHPKYFEGLCFQTLGLSATLTTGILIGILKKFCGHLLFCGSCELVDLGIFS